MVTHAFIIVIIINIIALTPKIIPVNVVYLIDRVLKIVFFRVRVHRVVVHHLPSFRHQVFANCYDDRYAILAGHVRLVLLWHAGFAQRFIRLELHAFVLTFFSYLRFGEAEESLSVRGKTHTRNVSISIKKIDIHLKEEERDENDTHINSHGS
jgi:hypothetical protein